MKKKEKIRQIAHIRKMEVLQNQSLKAIIAFLFLTPSITSLSYAHRIRFYYVRSFI